MRIIEVGCGLSASPDTSWTKNCARLYSEHYSGLIVSAISLIVARPYILNRTGCVAA